MKKLTKAKIFGGLVAIFGAALLSGCVGNFCSEVDQAHIAYPYEQGVTVYCSKEEIPEEYKADNGDADYPLSWQVYEGNDKLWAYIPVNTSGLFTAKKAVFLSDSIISAAQKNLIKTPTYAYWKKLDQKVLDGAISLFAEETLKKENENALPSESDISAKAVEIQKKLTPTDVNPFSVPDCIGNEEGVTINNDSILRNYGYWKFDGFDENGNHQLFGNWIKANEEIKKEFDDAGYDGAALVPNNDFVTVYKNAISSKFSAVRTCIATRDRAEGYGHYGPSNNWSVSIEKTSWGRAWSKGLFEGLIVYPVACLVDSLTFAMDPALTGVGQILALIVTTIVVRLVVMALTFKGTMDQQKMQALQPQLAKIQAKYPNSKENQAQAQRMQQETMALYKRNKVSMASTFIVLIVQFPVFISVWGALQGSAVLSSGEILNLRLSDSISSVLTNFSGAWYTNVNGWWTAGVLFVLMSVLQFLSVKLPQWITKAQTKNQAKLTANPTQDANSKRMKWMTYGMLIFTIVMGFALPAAMGVYWGIGALMSMVQTLITQLIMKKRFAKKQGKR
ncbi:MAG TPA: hypothetical protein DDW18_01680 [Firmicutes bacterium]|nr:hypothetical protein [Bacillota bacterium]